MKTILSREFKAYFTSPIGYVILAFYLLIFGFYCAGMNISQLNGNYDVVINSLTILLLFSMPLLTMRLLSEEKRNRTDQLLLTVPIHVRDIVLGKYLAATLLLLFTLGLTMLHPLILTLLGDVPWPSVFTAYIGYFLLGASLIAISLFVSALTESQIIAAIGSMGIFLLLLLIDAITTLIPAKAVSSLIFVLFVIFLVTLYLYSSIKDFYMSCCIGLILGTGTMIAYKLNPSIFEGLCIKVLQWFSLFSRYQNFSGGLLDVGSIIYFLSVIFIFLFLTDQTIEKRRWN